MSIVRNTLDVAWDAKVYGAVGSFVGFAGGLLYAWSGQEELNANTFKVAGVSALATGLVGQVGGMFVVNHQQGGRGLAFTGIGIPAGFGLGSAYAMYKKGSNSPVGIIKAGAVGSVIGGAAGATGDMVRAQL